MQHRIRLNELIVDQRKLRAFVALWSIAALFQAAHFVLAVVNGDTFNIWLGAAYIAVVVTLLIVYWRRRG